MARQARKTANSDTYHVMCRGVSRHSIFEDAADYRRYRELLETQANGGPLILFAWCLMDNHVHLVAKATLPELSFAMKSINCSYAQYFNKRHERVGHLFQGRFKSEPIETDESLLQVIRYVHRNPLEAGITQTLDYRWSSFKEYFGQAHPICSMKMIMDIAGGTAAFKSFHAESSSTSEFIEIERRKPRQDDARARAIAAQVLGENACEQVGSLPRQRRNQAIAKLRACGLSIREIERLLGVSRGIIGAIPPATSSDTLDDTSGT